jgi:hypothetical protein
MSDRLLTEMREAHKAMTCLADTPIVSVIDAAKKVQEGLLRISWDKQDNIRIRMYEQFVRIAKEAVSYRCVVRNVLYSLQEQIEKREKDLGLVHDSLTGYTDFSGSPDLPAGAFPPSGPGAESANPGHNATGSDNVPPAGEQPAPEVPDPGW